MGVRRAPFCTQPGEALLVAEAAVLRAVFRHYASSHGFNDVFAMTLNGSPARSLLTLSHSNLTNYITSACKFHTPTSRNVSRIIKLL